MNEEFDYSVLVDDRVMSLGGNSVRLPKILPMNPHNDLVMVYNRLRPAKLAIDHSIHKKSKIERKTLKKRKKEHNKSILSKSLDPKKVMNHNMNDVMESFGKYNGKKNSRGLFRNLSNFTITGLKYQSRNN